MSNALVAELAESLSRVVNPQRFCPDKSHRENVKNNTVGVFTLPAMSSPELRPPPAGALAAMPFFNSMNERNSYRQSAQSMEDTLLGFPLDFAPKTQNWHETAKEK